MKTFVTLNWTLSKTTQLDPPTFKPDHNVKWIINVYALYALARVYLGIKWGHLLEIQPRTDAEYSLQLTNHKNDTTNIGCIIGSVAMLV